jgi:hypothetical protein
VRIRIALTTAVAVIAVPAVLLTLFSSTPAASARVTRHEAVSQYRAVRIDMKLMSYAQAEKVAKLATFSDAVQKAEQASAFVQAVAAREDTIPAAWQATAICEEGGRDNAYAGYFGILEWHDFDGYPTAGSAPVSVQLAWEARYVGGPPDAPGQCHGY